MPQSDADGFTFTVQEMSPHALGGAGMGLGYGPDAVSSFDRGARIGQSVAVKFGLINNSTLQPRSSIGLYFDGATPSGGPTERDLTVSLHSGHRMLIAIEYAGGTLNVSVTDNLTKQRDSQSFQVNLPCHTGNSAYVGFTGGSGGKTSTQMLLSWQFVPLTT